MSCDRSRDRFPASLVSVVVVVVVVVSPLFSCVFFSLYLLLLAPCLCEICETRIFGKNITAEERKKAKATMMHYAMM